ncbi:hypothetical protein GQX74_000758 [Glossina fuscipes]|nr:hypothetical protein GQX74_000758 [Glossina fuscipes]
MLEKNFTFYIDQLNISAEKDVLRSATLTFSNFSIDTAAAAAVVFIVVVVVTVAVVVAVAVAVIVADLVDMAASEVIANNKLSLLSRLSGNIDAIDNIEGVSSSIVLRSDGVTELMLIFPLLLVLFTATDRDGVVFEFNGENFRVNHLICLTPESSSTTKHLRFASRQPSRGAHCPTLDLRQRDDDDERQSNTPPLMTRKR